MKKLLAIFLMATILFSFAGCSLSKIEIGSEDGVMYVRHSNQEPKVKLLVFEGQIVVENPVFFEKLVSCIDGKPEQETMPYYPNYIYVVEIGKYDFALHEEHIFIYSPLGYNVKGVKIIVVECTKEEIDELVALLDAVRYN